MREVQECPSTVPLPPWLAARMADYLAETHPHAAESTAPLWPGREATVVARVGTRRQTTYDWAEPVVMGDLLPACVQARVTRRGTACEWTYPQQKTPGPTSN